MSAWYRSGTIAVAGKTVTGTGTNWTDNKAGIGEGQALLIPGAGTVKVYEIARVDSATQLTLTDDAGNVTAGQAYAIMSFYANSIPDFSRRLAAQLSYYQSQMDGWQEIMTGTGSITLEAPDGLEVTISSLKKLTDDMNNKADKVNGAVPVEQGGTGAKTATDAWKALAQYGNAAGTAAQGNDPRLDTVAGKKGGSVVGGIGVKNNARAPAFVSESSNMWEEASGSYRNLLAQAIVDSNRYGIIDYYASNSAGRAYIRFIPYASPTSFFVATADHTGEMTARVFTPTSDARVKYQIEEIADPEEKLNMLRGVTFRYIAGDLFGIGLIGQDVENAFPEAVSKSPDPVVLPDGKVIDKVIRPDTYGVGVAVLTQMCKKLARQRDEAIKRADNQEAFLKKLGFDPEKDYTQEQPLQGS